MLSRLSIGKMRCGVSGHNHEHTCRVSEALWACMGSLDEDLLTTITKAIQYGKPFLFENLDEELDPMVEAWPAWHQAARTCC